jgi:hypothetical protein
MKGMKGRHMRCVLLHEKFDSFPSNRSSGAEVKASGQTCRTPPANGHSHEGPE